GLVGRAQRELEASLRQEEILIVAGGDWLRRGVIDGDGADVLMVKDVVRAELNLEASEIIAGDKIRGAVGRDPIGGRLAIGGPLLADKLVDQRERHMIAIIDNACSRC